MADSALIRIAALRKEFRMGDQTIHALDGMNLSVAAGEFVCVMGPSGSGKSTLLYLLGGLDRPSSGEIWVQDRNIVDLDENALAGYRQRQIGFVFQTFNLIATMTALQNVEFPMIFARVPPRQRRQRAEQLLATVGLGDRLEHKPTELSGGQQQRVAVARALVNDPRILLADEPTGNLDTHTGTEVLELLARLCRVEGRTIVVVTHDPRVAGYASHVVNLLDGQIVDEQEGGRDA